MCGEHIPAIGLESENEKILNTFKYFKKNFSSKEVNNDKTTDEFLRSCVLGKINEEEKVNLGKEIQIDEIHEIIKELSPTNKTIGPDKISNSILRYIGFDITLTKIANLLLNEEDLPKSINKCFIRLVFKNKGDRTDLANY